MSSITGDKLVGLMGVSVHHPDFKPILAELKEELPIAKKTNNNYLQIKKIWNHEFGVSIDYTTPIGYRNRTGQEPGQLFTTDMYELIVSELSIHEQGEKQVAYPFGLAIGQSHKQVDIKLGTKPAQKRKGKGGAYHNGYIYYYYTEKFRIIAYFTPEKTLLSLNIDLLSTDDRKYLVPKPAAKKLDAQISDKNIARIEQLKKSLPVEKWRKRMAKGDQTFTEKSLEAATLVLSTFLDQLTKAATDGKSAAVEAAVKKVVQAFNKLNPKHGHFVETMEREELVDFIQKAARLTGFEIAEDADVTEEWREW